MKLVEQLKSVLDGLRADPRIEVLEHPNAPFPISTKRIERLEDEIGGPLPEALKAFYLEVGRFNVQWRSWAEPDIWGGVELGTSFIKGRIWVAHDLYYYPKKGYFAVSVNAAKPGSTSTRKTTRKLTESFEEAYEIMLRARGAQGWAQAYLGLWTGTGEEAKRYSPREGLFQAAVPALFDDFELDNFGKAASIPAVTDLPSLDGQRYDLSGDNAGLSFASRLKRQMKIVSQSQRFRFFDVHFNPPVTQEEIDQVHETMGFELSEAFLNYFRSCNGFKFSAVAGRAGADKDEEELCALWTNYYEKGGAHASVNIPTLAEIFTPKAMPPMDGREWTRFFAYLDDPLPDGHAGKTQNMLAVDLNLGTSDPILRMATDYGAEPENNAPVEACTYFEWLTKQFGEYNELKHLFKQYSHSVSGPIHKSTPEELDQFCSTGDHLSSAFTLSSIYWNDGRIEVPEP
ncbi:SMI1/KNR4 family protein [Bradymonas sediminis]|uniref:Uncharacterized protein n=1 Tax=Bradymonas sediminis TaxID=1548548 RepID=A0A2Z4FI80_9DELT|nr:SMI1/KNR4 family protein [Bradymonas sediminis]AWV88717.1 hypothetical protein DN745_04945 [Bradymonas sediminis]TDP63591.1 hypothetical protein DFR33_11048 [Bradymonas sediminis]